MIKTDKRGEKHVTILLFFVFSNILIVKLSSYYQIVFGIYIL